jgi:hypothetical protein
VSHEWWVIDTDADVLHTVNEVTDTEWTRADALKQQLYAEADGCDGTVLALLIVHEWDCAYFVQGNELHVAPLLVDGRPALEDAAAVDVEHAQTGGVEIDWIIEQFAA